MKRPSAIALATLVAVAAIGVSVPAAAGQTRNASEYFLSAGPSSSTFFDPHHRDFTETFTLVNGNSRKAYVRRVGSDGPGLQLLSSPTQQSNIETILPHKSVRLVVSFHVSDCSLVPKSSWPLTMDFSWRITGVWHRVSLRMQGDPSSSWPWSETSHLCE